jgi:hypothetical protein
MSVEGVAEEFDRYRPEIAILNNSDTAVHFRRLLDSNYRLVYQDDRYQLYAITNIIRAAQAPWRRHSCLRVHGTFQSRVPVQAKPVPIPIQCAGLPEFY